MDGSIPHQMHDGRKHAMNPKTSSSLPRQAPAIERLHPSSSSKATAAKDLAVNLLPCEMSTDQCLEELRGALHTWIPNLIRQQIKKYCGWDTDTLDEIGKALYKACQLDPALKDRAWR